MAVKKKPSEQPVAVEVTTYNVGLGDCLLLKFTTKLRGRNKQYRVLIDCGSTGRNKDGPSLAQVAEQIVEDCGGVGSEVDAVVISHRHRDHMSGFGGEAGEFLCKSLRPKLIVQPWTEDPRADDPSSSRANLPPAAARYVRSLSDAQALSKSILQEILVRREKGMGRNTDEEAIFYSEKNFPFKGARNAGAVEPVSELEEALNIDGIRNLDALNNIHSWSWKRGNRTRKPRYRYLRQGQRLNLSVPGLKVKVLGPVGPDHWERLDSDGNTDELWAKLQGLRNDPESTTDSNYVAFKPGLGPYGAQPIFEDHQVPDGDQQKDSVRWLIENLDQLRGTQLLGFVRTLDRHINNTSLVLLLNFGGFQMLFPGDAEVAAWEAIAEDSRITSKLKEVDLYKVGHHASNNATPRMSLWKHLTEERDESRPLHCIVSTQTTKFPGSIPNRTLLDTMLTSDSFHVVSTAYPESSSPSIHADDWEINEVGRGRKRLTMSYSREFQV